MGDQMNMNALLATPVFSRRTLFAATAIVGSLHFLGSALCGRAQVNAYADEAGNTSFVVVIMRKDEISVMAVDARDALQAVEGFTVTVTSGFNGKTGQATTDKFGVAIINIRELSEQCDDADAEDFFCFVSAMGRKPGYRDYVVERAFVVGGANASQTASLTIATQPFDTAKDGAYLRSVSFNGLDVQYFPANFPKFAANTAVHELSVQVASKPAAKVGVTLLANGALLAGAVYATTDAEGFATCVLSGDWIQTQAVGTAFAVRFEANGSVWEMPLKLYLDEPPMGLSAPIITDNALLSVGSGLGLGDPTWESAAVNAGSNPLGVADPTDEQMLKAPDPTDEQILKAGLLGESPSVVKNIIDLPFATAPAMRLVADMPWMPITFAMTPDGGVGISFNMKTFNIYDSQNGFFDNKGWMKWGYKNNCQTWRDQFYERLNKSLERWDTAQVKPKDRKVGKSTLFGGANATLDFSAMALLYPREDDCSGTLKAMLTFIFTAEFGKQISVAGFPVYFAIDFYLQSDFRVEAGLVFSTLDTYFMKSPSGQGGFNIDIVLIGGLSVAAGIKGVLALGIRGFCQLPMQFGFQDPPEEEGEKPFPHKVVKLSGGVQIFLQVLFFTFSVNVWKSPEKTFLDNWQTKAALQAVNAGEDAAGMWVDPAIDPAHYGAELHLTTDADLLSGGNENGAERIRAQANRQGVVHAYDLSRVNLATRNFNAELAAAGFGFVMPYSESGELGEEPAYDMLAGMRPTLRGRLARKAFSDTRIKTVQLGDVVYYCRLAVVEVDVSGLMSAGAQVYEEAGLHFVVPRSTAFGGEAAGGEAAGGEGAAGSEALLRAPSLVYAGNGETLGAESEEEWSVPGVLVCTDTFDDVQMYADQNAKVQPAVAMIPVPYSGAETEEELQAVIDAIKELVSADANARTRYKGNARPANISTVPRVRVVVTPYDLEAHEFGEADVIDFVIPSTGVSTMRCNINDVDFSVISDGEALRFGLVSAARPWDAEKTFDEQKDCMFTSCLRYDPALRSGQRISEVYSNLAEFLEKGDYEWCAQPVMVSREGDGKHDYVCLATTGHKYGDDRFVLHYYPVAGSVAPRENTAYVVPPAEDALNDFGQMHVFVPRDMRSASGADTVALCWQYNEPDVQDARVAIWLLNAANPDLQTCTHIASARNLTVLGEGRGLAYVRETDDGEHHMNMYRAFVKSPKEMETEQFLGTFDSGEFYASADGTCLFGMNVMESEDDRRYQIRCARWEPLRDGYHSFFNYGQLETAPDNSAMFRQTRSTSFLYSTVTNLELQRADINYAEIPELAALQLDGVGCFDAFVAPGGATVHPVVRVTNTGNLPLCGFTVQLRNVATGLEQQVVLDDLRDYVMPACDAASVLNGQAELAQEADWDKKYERTLWPGDTRQYRVALEVPASWTSGTYEIEVTLADLVVDLLEEGGVLTANAGGAAAGGAGSLASALAGAVQATSQALFFPDPRTGRTAVEVGEQAKISAAPDVKPSEYTRVESLMPKTGDGAGLGVAVAAGAAVVAGAGAVAAGVKHRGAQAGAAQDQGSAQGGAQ